MKHSGLQLNIVVLFYFYLKRKCIIKSKLYLLLKHCRKTSVVYFGRWMSPPVAARCDEGSCSQQFLTQIHFSQHDLIEVMLIFILQDNPTNIVPVIFFSTFSAPLMIEVIWLYFLFCCNSFFTLALVKIRLLNCKRGPYPQ